MYWVRMVGAVWNPGLVIRTIDVATSRQPRPPLLHVRLVGPFAFPPRGIAGIRARDAPTCLAWHVVDVTSSETRPVHNSALLRYETDTTLRIAESGLYEFSIILNSVVANARCITSSPECIDPFAFLLIV